MSVSPSTGQSRPTLDRVATLAGVSKATASKALNGRPGVSVETRRRVESAIHELGYVPSTGAREGAPLNQVTVVFDTLINVYSMEVLDGVIRAGRDHGVDVVVETLAAGATGPGPAPLSRAWVRQLAASGRNGVVVVTSEVTPRQRSDMAAAGVSLVAIDPQNAFDDGVVSVGATNFTGGTQAARHLLDLGHTRIAFAGGPPASPASTERLHGYRSQLAAAGLEPEQALVRLGGFSYEAGIEMGTELLALPEPPTAVFAGCDASALGIIEAARRSGRRVPDDLSVVGFDDTYAAVSAAPPLTTVRQPVVDMGRVAVRTLIQLVRNERPDSHHIQLATRLVVRESTAALPAGR